MTGPRVNLAVTNDGESYNKLKRPADYLVSTPVINAAERKQEFDHAPAGGQTESKRPKMEPSSLQADNFQGRSRNGGPVAECGMRETIPFGDDEFDDEELRPDEDAIAYLLGVRSEASTIPRLLGGHKNEYDNNDEHVFCEDGTWIAIDKEESDEEGTTPPVTQGEYYTQLLRRFQAIRRTLAKLGTQDALQEKNSSKTGPRKQSSQSPQSKHEWQRAIDDQYPTLSWTLQLNEKTVLDGLEYCAHAISQSNTISTHMSCWIWTLLALLGDSGTLDHEKMARIRDIGCRAGQLGIMLRKNMASTSPANVIESLGQSPSNAEDDPESCMSTSRNEELSGGDNETLNLEEARARLLAQLGDRLVVQPRLHSEHEQSEPAKRSLTSRVEAESQRQQAQNQAAVDPDDLSRRAVGVDLNTTVTIDMILTVVAECYGQKDLLGFRAVW